MGAPLLSSPLAVPSHTPPLRSWKVPWPQSFPCPPVLRILSVSLSQFPISAPLFSPARLPALPQSASPCFPGLLSSPFAFVWVTLPLSVFSNSLNLWLSFLCFCLCKPATLSLCLSLSLSLSSLSLSLPSLSPLSLSLSLLYLSVPLHLSVHLALSLCYFSLPHVSVSAPLCFSLSSLSPAVPCVLCLASHTGLQAVGVSPSL